MEFLAFEINKPGVCQNLYQLTPIAAQGIRIKTKTIIVSGFMAYLGFTTGIC